MPFIERPKTSSSYFSPDIFGLYDTGSAQQTQPVIDGDEKILPVAQLFQNFSNPYNQKNPWLEFFREVTGYSDLVATIQKNLTTNINRQKRSSFKDPAVKLLHNVDKTRNLNDIYTMLNQDQLSVLNKLGYAFLETAQLQNLHNDQSLNDLDIGMDLETYEKMTLTERELALLETVRKLGRRNRYKREEKHETRETTFTMTEVMGGAIETEKKKSGEEGGESKNYLS